MWGSSRRAGTPLLGKGWGLFEMPCIIAPLSVSKQARGYIKVNETIAVLRGDALKSRHWKMLTRNLNVNWDMAILTLGQVCSSLLLAALPRSFDFIFYFFGGSYSAPFFPFSFFTSPDHPRSGLWI